MVVGRYRASLSRRHRRRPDGPADRQPGSRRSARALPEYPTVRGVPPRGNPRVWTGQGARRAQSRWSAMGTRIYVGNLPFNVTEDQIRQLFGAEGRSVTEVHIVMDRETARPRGFAFVEMGSDKDAQGAINALTKCTAVDWGRDGIRINALCPAGVHTETLRQWMKLQPDAAGIETYLNQIHALGYCPEPTEIATVAAFLCSDEAKFITGYIMPVSGGSECGYNIHAPVSLADPHS
ncbi:MAG: SDR family oxidoreductase [Deltaproteobacteria bacterium]